jgi:hypothetical protein
MHFNCQRDPRSLQIEKALSTDDRDKGKEKNAFWHKYGMNYLRTFAKNAARRKQRNMNSNKKVLNAFVRNLPECIETCLLTNSRYLTDHIEPEHWSSAIWKENK